MEEFRSLKKPLKQPLKDPLKMAEIDRGEHESQMEPLLLSTERRGADLDDLVLDLVKESASFRSSLPPAFVAALGELVRSMNCYYSNLIEGHYTHPLDIEKARKKNYSEDPVKRNLQLEAEAHIAVQTWIDGGGITGQVMTLESLKSIHRKFCELLPDELLWIENPETKQKIRVLAGELRTHDVKVGNHYAISPGAVQRFMLRFENVYTSQNRSNSILSAAAAHHRFLWIHPFLDGNGRVARLMSYAALLELAETGGIWSIARGLARQQSQYKSHLAECDHERRGDVDGRGPLSERSLEAFTRFFLETCIDQIRFMKSLTRPDLLRKRILSWAQDESEAQRLPIRAVAVLDSLLTVGELPRGDIQPMLDVSPATARRVIAALTEQGVLVSESTRAPVRLAFPASVASHWFPGLFPDQ